MVAGMEMTVDMKNCKHEEITIDTFSLLAQMKARQLCLFQHYINYIALHYITQLQKNHPPRWRDLGLHHTESHTPKKKERI